MQNPNKEKIHGDATVGRPGPLFFSILESFGMVDTFVESLETEAVQHIKGGSTSRIMLATYNVSSLE